jgi:tRNA(Arg) A34 adenosine deaminase TadA
MINDLRIQKAFNDLSKVAAVTPKVANYRLAAAIFYKNRLVTYGTSSYKTSPFQKKYAADEWKIFLHAEIATIKNALRFLDQWQLKKSTLYICRVKHGGKWGNSKPCSGCQRAIAEFGIKNVLYTVENGYDYL